MNPRKTPRLIPDRPHYLTLEVDGDAIDWRIPSIAKCAKVLQMLQKSGIMEAYQKSGEDGEALIATLGDRLPSLFVKMPPSPRTPSVTKIPRTLGGQTIPVGWNWMNSISNKSAPA